MLALGAMPPILYLVSTCQPIAVTSSSVTVGYHSPSRHSETNQIEKGGHFAEGTYFHLVSSWLLMTLKSKYITKHIP